MREAAGDGGPSTAPTERAVIWATGAAAYNAATVRLEGLEALDLDGVVVERGDADEEGRALQVFVVDLQSPFAMLSPSTEWVRDLVSLRASHVVLRLTVRDCDEQPRARLALVCEGDAVNQGSLALLERVRAAARRQVEIDGTTLREGEDYRVTLASPADDDGSVLPLLERLDRAGVAWVFVDAAVWSRRDDPARGALEALAVEVPIRALARRVSTFCVVPPGVAPANVSTARDAARVGQAMCR